MSARASWHVWCDHCQQEMNNSDQGCATAEHARRQARGSGGHRSHGRDVCEFCWEEGKR